MKSLRKAKNCLSAILPNSHFGQTGIIFFLFVLSFFCIFIGKLVTPSSFLLVVGMAGGLLIALIAFLDMDFALNILIFSMLLSPEIPVGNLIERNIVIRVDDILVIFIFFAWLAKMAVNKDLGLLRKTPVNLPILLYVFILIVSTSRGIILGTIRPLEAFFYLLKYIEYTMIFFLVVNNIKSLGQIKRLVFFLLLVYAVVCIFSTRQLWVSGFSPRIVTAPFDDIGHREPNTLAGYLLFLIGINVGLFLYSTSIRNRLLLIGLLILAILPFVWSFSRSAWLGAIFLYFVFMLLGKRMKECLLVSLVLLVMFLPQVLPQQVTNRVKSTFEPGREEVIFSRSIVMDASSSDRLEAWKYILTTSFPKYPMIGSGVTGVGLADSQYFRVLGEVGFIGFIFFMWLMVSILRVAFKNFRTIHEMWAKGLSIGFLAGCIGLMVQGVFANVFIIVRIMEPFMFMTALMMALGDFADTVSLS